MRLIGDLSAAFVLSMVVLLAIMPPAPALTSTPFSASRQGLTPTGDVVNAARLAPSSSTYPAGIELDLLTADACGWPVTGFVADPAFPDVVAGPHFWRRWWEYYIGGKLPPGTRVFCGVTLPAFSTDSTLAGEAAYLAGVGVADDEGPAAVCNAIVAAANP